MSQLPSPLLSFQILYTVVVIARSPVLPSWIRGHLEKKTQGPSKVTSGQRLRLQESQVIGTECKGLGVAATLSTGGCIKETS